MLWGALPNKDTRFKKKEGKLKQEESKGSQTNE